MVSIARVGTGVEDDLCWLVVGVGESNVVVGVVVVWVAASSGQTRCSIPRVVRVLYSIPINHKVSRDMEVTPPTILK